MSERLRPGRPYPLGVHLTGDEANVAVYSSVARSVSLCLFDDDGTERRLALPDVDAGVWHGVVGGVAPGQRYGFRVDGPYDPDRGLRCNVNKLLVDPYARAISGDVTFTPAAYGHDLVDGNRPSTLDSAAVMPKSVMVQSLPALGPDEQGTAAAGGRARTGTCPTPSSTRCTSRASPSAIPPCRPTSAAPTPVSRTPPC